MLEESPGEKYADQGMNSSSCHGIASIMPMGRTPGGTDEGVPHETMNRSGFNSASVCASLR